MTLPYDSVADQVQKFRVWFLFRIFADENFAGSNWNEWVEIRLLYTDVSYSLFQFER